MKRILLALSLYAMAATTALAQIVTGSVPNTFVNGTIIDATQMNADFTYIINQVNANGAKNGVNSDITALLSLTTPVAPSQGGSSIYYAGTATGTANAVVVSTAIPSGFTLATGKAIRFVVAASNTGAVTLAVNGTTATAVLKQSPAGLMALTGGELAAGDLAEAYFDGTRYQVLTRSNENGGFSAQASIASAATTDIGTAGSHLVSITGGGTISSFGSSASTVYPIYAISVVSATTLTASANLLTPGGANLVLSASDTILAQYAGAGVWRVLTVMPVHPKISPTRASQLHVVNNAATPASKVDIGSTEMVMDATTGDSYYVESYGTCTVDLTVNGAAGLDTGTFANNTWYFLYAISDGSTNSCLASTSSTAPTMPSGYTFKIRVGATRTLTAAPAELWYFSQYGNTTQITGASANSNRSINNGIVGTCNGTLVDTGAVYGVFAPSTATAVKLSYGAGNGVACVASTTTSVISYCVVNSSSANPMMAQATLGREAVTTIAYCGSTVSSNVNIAGWTDNLNAN